ncbi:MAG: ATP-binding protein [Methylovirgula sp.]|uniref:ATP-binding protein n=1 Tax=Methylovirgula sp. TaxID=1978224 RepID=UPI0030764919
MLDQMLAREDTQIAKPEFEATPHASSRAEPKTAPPISNAANRKNMVLLIQFRWVAVVGQLVTITMVQYGLGILLPLPAMLAVLAALILVNVASFIWLRLHEDISSAALLLVSMLDVFALTAQLWLSGGATNPFVSLYLLQITMAAILLDAQSTWLVVALAFTGFVVLVSFHQPLEMPRRWSGDMFSLHIFGMLVCFILNAALLVVFLTRITRNLSERDARLAALRQSAIEEDHIVRIGLLATGAAHELGTPLASLSVILGDWRRMPLIKGNAEMRQEVEEMQAAVNRCKAIVTDILLSAGEARGEAPSITTVTKFLDDIVASWREGRPAAVLSYENKFGTDLPIVSDSALKQIVFNVLDNAVEASPTWVGFTAMRDTDSLILEVSDLGSGFAPEILANFGRPYQSSKGRAGRGLGLFLVVNVVRKLGGIAEARNRAGRGAIVTLRLPLTALVIGAPHYAE